MGVYGILAKNGAEFNRRLLISDLRNYLNDLPANPSEITDLDLVTKIIADVATGLWSMRAINCAMDEIEEYGQIATPNFERIKKRWERTERRHDRN